MVYGVVRQVDNLAHWIGHSGYGRYPAGGGIGESDTRVNFDSIAFSGDHFYVDNIVVIRFENVLDL
ncbi:MAG: Regulator of ribonuclease activity A [Sodalis sp.]|uniref:hypothetical protein n=1 Tax=Sodalis sp. (in: enterobacteria) TaxID=1898979 RepID=UPI003873AAFD|nr:MAG: Regulator of ribonuclease activity A [Sodalis sp.]